MRCSVVDTICARASSGMDTHNVAIIRYIRQRNTAEEYVERLSCMFNLCDAYVSGCIRSAKVAIIGEIWKSRAKLLRNRLFKKIASATE